MSSLMAELDQDPEMKQQFEKMMQELMAAGAASSGAETSKHFDAAVNAAPTEGAKKDEFGDTIRRTMERMQQSGDAATQAASSNADGADEFLVQMMQKLQAGAGAGEGDVDDLLANMLMQLTHKEILYEPMKNLHDKFPAWLDTHEDIDASDRQRYEEQYKLTGEIVARFEREGYSNENDEDSQYIVERMQKMHASGKPPSDLVDDADAAEEALAGLDECPQQ
ncbi:Pex19 protein [Piedraia hortae CBS 480.64]|uniref:Pex19 protein n=1 Tax=Piedraia hortae CBS 480.64 TaxID=1314780 RepID=A0A6A7CB77_9PEZI|nr:Pex19 protein [Piedraia hortae CBS 480.64]